MPIAQSSHLQSHEYDADTQTLKVEFLDGSVYYYAGVPMDKAEGLRRNGGSGAYFWANIRNAYPATKISGPRSEKQ